MVAWNHDKSINLFLLNDNKILFLILLKSFSSFLLKEKFRKEYTCPLWCQVKWSGGVNAIGCVAWNSEKSIDIVTEIDTVNVFWTKGNGIR